jgi:hypothetical protein
MTKALENGLLPRNEVKPSNLARKLKLILRISVAGIVLIGLAIQFIPYGREHDNPPVIAEPRWDSAQTRALFARACADCHSNETSWPWYSNVAPVSWLVQRDVEEGRAKWNVSEWGRPENESEEAAETVQNDTMPLRIYTLLHPQARLSAAEKQALIDGFIATFGNEGQGETGEGDD